MKRNGHERRSLRTQKGRERALRTTWARLYCKVYGPPSPVVAATWRTMCWRLAAGGHVPGAAS